MQRRFSKEPTEQAEAKAVSNLLEIALKQQEDSNNWEERRGKDQLQNKNRTHSHFRLKDVPEQHRTAKNCLKHRYFISSREKPPHGDLANSLKEPASGRNPTPTPPLINQGGSQSIEGDFWLSKVNWMADASIKDHPSELRLHRKRSTGFQNHGKAARERGSRYQNPQRLLSRELKNNLAVNLSKQRVQVRQNGRSISKVPSIQEYVRETFDKIYERHHEENAYSPYKQSQQEKSTIVRKLLNNLESIKDVPARKTRQRVDPPYLSKQIKEVISAPPVPRRAYHRRDQRSILNLNEEAEKVYESRSINQFTRKDSASIKPK